MVERKHVHGVISAGDPETAAAGAAMLRQGGNAIDAAVAAAFASFVAEIGVVHLGGSGIAQVYDPQHGRAAVYDFFSNAPGLGRPKLSRLDFHEVMIDFGATTQNFHLGRASVAVPGNIFGLCRMAAEHGRLPLATLLAPAIRLAADGVALAPFQAQTCHLLAPLYTHTAGMRHIFGMPQRMIQAGERLFIPDLANTLRMLAVQGEQFARSGALAQALVADQEAHDGLLTMTDLEQFEVYTGEAIRVPYRDYEILLPGPSSSGGVLTAFTLQLLSAFELGGLQHGGAAHLRLLYECMVATNRARVYWEEWSSRLPVADAIDRFLDPGFVRPFQEAVRAALDDRSASPFVPEPPAPNNTSHLSVIDASGMAVSLTTTAGESAGYVVPGTGFIPNNIMGEEDLHPRGFHSRPAGERIPTMMTPAMVLLNGQPRLVVGSGGSIRIRSAIMQVLSNLLDFKMKLQEAVDAPRVHVESGALQCEAGYDAAAVDGLEQMGYVVNRWPVRSIYFGGAHSASRTPDGRLIGAGDNRRGGAICLAEAA